MRFEKKVAIVTGGGSGFGEAIAKKLAAEGASVVVADKDSDGGKRVSEEIIERQQKSIFVQTDVSNSDDIQSMIKAAVDTYGGLDVLVNNAGYSHRSMPFWELPDEDFDNVFAVNARGVYLGMKYAVPEMVSRGGGVMVNTASIGATAPRPGVTAYNATKGAVVTMTRGAAVELAEKKIRVCAVNPVAAETGFMVGAVGMDKLPDNFKGALTKTIPWGRLCEPDDVAKAVAFLASDDAEFLTGVCLDVDGGRSIS